MKKIYIIAEAGVNHNGKVGLAKKMIDAAAEAKADAIKFQTFVAEKVVSRFAPKAEYQKLSTSKKESQLEMLKKLEFDAVTFKEIVEYCHKKKIEFISSPFDMESIDLLRRLKVKIIKIPSGEITNLPYLRKIGKLKKKIILSSGMSNLKEIQSALGILTQNGTAKNHITVLHCCTDYPARMEDANLRAMNSIKTNLGVDTGYSDHTLGIEVSIAAVAMGATVIEKHFTLSRDLPGPDHKASLEPQELRSWVNSIRNTEKSLGSFQKKPCASELKNRNIVRKSIVASCNIEKGEVFTSSNLTVKRPGNGINPMEWDKIMGKRAKKNFMKDELIKI